MIELGDDPPDQPSQARPADEGGFPSIAVERPPAPAKAGWGNPLVIAMIVAALGGLGVAVAMSGAGKSRPAVVAKSEDEDAAPTRLLQIQVKNAPVKPVAEPTSVMPAPVAADSPATPAPLPTPPAPVQLASTGDRPHSAPPPAPARSAPPLDLAALADPEMASADRALAAAFRDAQSAGVSPRELQAERRAWQSARAEAGRSRGALLDAYEDHIGDLHDLADDAGRQARRDDRYAEDREDEGGAAYAAPYRGGYGRPSGY